MIVKGIISAIYEDQKKLSVILPEYDNMTTPPLDIYGEPIMSNYAVNDFVLVMVFNGDFTDLIVLAKPTTTVAEIKEAVLSSSDNGNGDITILVIADNKTLTAHDNGAGNITFLLT